MPSLIAVFRGMPDPRSGNAQRHDLLDILAIALVASVCGAEAFRGPCRVRLGPRAAPAGVSRS